MNALLTRRTDRTITAVVTVLTLLCGAGYVIGLYFLSRRWSQRARSKAFTLNKWPRRLVPAFHICLTLGSVLEAALTSWLLAQFSYLGRYPNIGSRDGVRTCLVAAGWTLVFSVVLTLMFLHPSLWRHPVASAGSQAIWILVTWCIWVAATATMNRGLPLINSKARCAGVDYCSQLRAAFGLSLAAVLLLTLGMVGMMWSFWKAYRTAGSSRD
ncbi:hypothetical protein PHLGIDRAFT_466157 [Phlebiopsis gigantea 11061_1 CR5-6]|uniref:MARVEL domain-containing protein n=1 Tax=Phlebiopsis gigantea (strain 11061_1 CR5-6) TaxID=745531 RepID=A0A0C3PJD3_PHLG1|nr:hypothetical protein PHLGIDRAFT_466157 [Phlebiopsis gigantea 11061_1 CR5-6]